MDAFFLVLFLYKWLYTTNNSPLAAVGCMYDGAFFQKHKNTRDRLETRHIYWDPQEEELKVDSVALNTLRGDQIMTMH